MVSTISASWRLRTCRHQPERVSDGWRIARGCPGVWIVGSDQTESGYVHLASWSGHGAPGRRRERIYLDRFWNELSRTEAIYESKRQHYAALYAQPGAMRAGFAQFLTFGQDAADNRTFLARGKLQMPVLGSGGEATFGPMIGAVMRCVADNVEDVIIPDCGHWITEEQPRRRQIWSSTFCIALIRIYSRRLTLRRKKHDTLTNIPKSLIAGFLLTAVSTLERPLSPTPSRVRNVVIVHGAWADGSSWSKVIPLLQSKGLHVVAVQNPLTSLLTTLPPPSAPSHRRMALYC